MMFFHLLDQNSNGPNWHVAQIFKSSLNWINMKWNWKLIAWEQQVDEEESWKRFNRSLLSCRLFVVWAKFMDDDFEKREKKKLLNNVVKRSLNAFKRLVFNFYVSWTSSSSCLLLLCLLNKKTKSLSAIFLHDLIHFKLS
jgi:hypothetical protein